MKLNDERIGEGGRCQGSGSGEKGANRGNYLKSENMRYCYFCLHVTMETVEDSQYGEGKGN